ncbi:DODA-type extradiol aromatic ring-opening family dioxygenase [Acidithiobacillus sp.]|uniref:DODA-type extradiol aromatic ring-opening family dioxygenase n=1 Tax=Acidithiobacillus sp. TaxID=1872118 RepID=UPI003D06DB9E
MIRQPTLFLPHGAGPCFFMEWHPSDTWGRHRAFLEDLSSGLPACPKALLVISAHWEATTFTLQKNTTPGLLFDYFGFPAHTYQLDWPAPGDPGLAERTAALLQAAGLDADFDEKRGFDHGVFVPLKIAFPEADIPCVQLSLHAGLESKLHLSAGAALAPLRDEGVLIIGSGNSFHNMRVLMAGMREHMGGATGREFDDWLTHTVIQSDPQERNRRLACWAEAPGARHAQPREEHLAPLFVIAGAAGDDLGRKTFEDEVLGAVESAFQFGEGCRNSC